MDTFLSEWYPTLWALTAVCVYLGFFFKDRKKKIQNGEYGFWLLVVSVIVGFLWIFTVPMYTLYLLTQIPKAINWFLQELKRQVLPSSYDRWT